MKSLKNLCSAAALLLSAIPVAADGTWSVGVFGGVESSLYVGGERADGGIAPFLAYDTEHLHIGFDGVSYKVIADRALTVGVALDWRFDPDFPDGALFDGLDRSTAFEGGVFARYRIGGASYVGGSFMHDLSSEHGGYEGDLHVGTELTFGSVGIDISVGGKLRSGDLNQYLVGVSAAEANRLRSEYSPGSSVVPYIELTAGLPVSDRVTLIGAFSYEHVGSTYKDSPLVDKGSTSSVSVGVLYRF